MELNGLPLHALIVHAAVVFGPLGALTALAYAVLSRWRDRLRLPMLVMALVATAAVLAAYFSGDNLLATRPELAQKPRVGTHEERAELLLWLVLAFGVVAVGAHVLHARSGAVRLVTRVGLALVSLAVLVQVVLVGEAGARAVWEI